MLFTRTLSWHPRPARYVFVVAALFTLVLLESQPARALGKLCILPANADISGTPCTDALNASDGQSTAISFDSCSGPQSVKAVFEQETGNTSDVLAFQVNVSYDPARLDSLACTIDPDHYFEALAGEECPGNYIGETTYAFAGKINILGDIWPASNPNFVLIILEFGQLNIQEGTTTTLDFFNGSAAKTNKLHDGGVNSLLPDQYPAHVTCGQTVFVQNNVTGDETVRNENNTLYDVNVTVEKNTTIKDIHVRACSTNASCGDIIDWTPLVTDFNQKVFSADWKLPDAVWQALPNDTSYIQLKATFNDSTSLTTQPLFFVVKKSEPMPPSDFVAYIKDMGVDLSWVAPVKNADGSTVDSLAGYKIYSLESCDSTGGVLLNNDLIPANQLQYTLKAAPAYDYFTVTAINDYSLESEPSSCIAAVTPTNRYVAGTLVTYDRANGPVADSEYPDKGVASITVQLMNGEEVVAQGTSNADGTFKFQVPEGATATYSVRALIPTDSGYVYKTGTATGDVAPLEIDSLEVGAAGTFNAKKARVSAGPSAGDFNCDGVVDIMDFGMLKMPFGSKLGEDDYVEDLDINGDGIIDIMDFALLKNTFGMESETARPDLCSSE